MLYDMVWVRLKAYILPKLKRLTKSGGELNSIDELFDRAADVETQLETFNKQQLKTPGESSHPGGRYHNFCPSISGMKDLANKPSKPDKCITNRVAGQIYHRRHW